MLQKRIKISKNICGGTVLKPWTTKIRSLPFNFVKVIFFPFEKGAITSDDGEYKAGYDLDASQADLDASSNSTAKAQFSSLEYQDADVPNILP